MGGIPNAVICAVDLSPGTVSSTFAGMPRMGTVCRSGGGYAVNRCSGDVAGGRSNGLGQDSHGVYELAGRGRNVRV